MKLKFLPYETRVSPAWNWSANLCWHWITSLFKRAKQGGDT